MKGLILAGGKGTRLRPMTNVVNKHILPVYDKPVIYYPVKTLLQSGIDDIMVISTPEAIGRYIQLLEEDFDAEFRYRVQKEPKGIADALSLAEDFVDDKVAVMLGDNIILDNLESEFEAFSNEDANAKIFLKQVERPSRYGIAELDGGDVTRLSEKPDDPESNYAIIGLYLYQKEVFDVIPTLKPSDRGELEITDANRTFLNRDALTHSVIESQWFDVGTPEGLFRAAECIRSQRQQQSNRD
jgi:glucose-1-phosphate thymidylyltransferase